MCQRGYGSCVIFFGGSYPTDITRRGPSPYDQSPVWTTDETGTSVSVVRYPGNKHVNKGRSYYNEVPGTGKEQQAINAQGLLPDDNVDLIAYSAGTESALMYAQWRLENGQDVNSIVLLGPTFETSEMDFGYPDGGWSAVMDDLIEQGVNIYVLDDDFREEIDIAGYQPPTCIGCGAYHKEREKYLPHYSSHPRLWPGSNNSERLKNNVYTWLTEPQ